jgi:hypothetical protein
LGTFMITKIWSANIGFGRSTAYALAVGLSSYSLSAQSTENGNSQWPIGVQSVLAAIMPPPGATQFYSYTQYYHADKFVDSKGRRTVPGFKLDVVATATRVIHTWEKQVDGWDVSSGATLAGNSVDVHAAGSHDKSAGLNYAYLNLLYFTYQLDNLHFMFGPSLYVPLGRFDKAQLANPSYNYYGYSAEAAVTYTPSPRLELSAQSVVVYNSRNHDTGYRSGGMINTDFNINYSFIEDLPQLQFGLSGYYAQQIQDDEINGDVVGDGNRLRKFAVGPQLLWYFNAAAGVAVKWQHELGVKNGPVGDRLWVQFSFPL